MNRSDWNAGAIDTERAHAWAKREDLLNLDWKESENVYPFANLIYKPEKKRIRLNYSSWFAILTGAAFIISWIIFR